MCAKGVTNQFLDGQPPYHGRPVCEMRLLSVTRGLCLCEYIKHVSTHSIFVYVVDAVDLDKNRLRTVKK